jgi:hypothetical protein
MTDDRGDPVTAWIESLKAGGCGLRTVARKLELIRRAWTREEAGA